MYIHVYIYTSITIYIYAFIIFWLGPEAGDTEAPLSFVFCCYWNRILMMILMTTENVFVDELLLLLLLLDFLFLVLY